MAIVPCRRSFGQVVKEGVFMKVRIGSVIACLSLLAAFANAVRPLEAASTILVPADQPTIQAAIAAASSGDTILVSPGTYVENLNFSGKAINVESLQGPAYTIIDGNQSGPVVTFASGETLQSVLFGFTVRNGNATAASGEGGGISIANSSPTIFNNFIINNSASNGGGGIAISGGSPLIQSNLIRNNGQTSGYSGGVGGGGIAIVGASSAQVLGNTVTYNSWYSSSGGGISLFAAGTPTIANNVVSNNTAYSQGGGFYIVNQSDASIVQNLIIGNAAATGGGLYWLVPSGGRGPLLINNTIYGNHSPQGSGVFTDGFDAQAEMLNNIIVAASGQTAVTCGNFTTNVPIFLTNDVFSDTGLAYGGTCGSQTGSKGNISADPLFMNASAGNFHLQGGSPAIDTATNTTIAPAQDFDGISRPQDGNGDSVAIMDMGIYEFPQRDLTPPVTFAAESPAPGPLGWTTAFVSITLTATDNPGGSGVQNIQYSLSGAQVSPLVVAENPATFAITAEGTTTISYAASDVAGNVEATKSVTVNIDKTAPVTVANATPAANAAGWNANNLTVTLNSTDNAGGSGVQSIRYWLNGNQSNAVVITGNSATIAVTAEGSTTISYAASDVAGNVEATKSVTDNIDKTAPVISGMPAPGCTISPANNKLVQVAAVTGSDSLSGLLSLNVTASSAPPASQGDIVIGGGTVQLRAVRGRIYTVVATANDIAGNTATATAACTVSK